MASYEGYNIDYGKYGVKQGPDSRVVIPTAVDLYLGEDARKVGFAQSVRPRETRPTTVVRVLNSEYAGMPVDQIPQPPEFGLTITRLAVYDYAYSILNVFGIADEPATPAAFLYCISEQRLPFVVVRTRQHPVSKMGYRTLWYKCMIISIDEGEDNIGTAGTPIVETVDCTALYKKVKPLKS